MHVEQIGYHVLCHLIYNVFPIEPIPYTFQKNKDYPKVKAQVHEEGIHKDSNPYYQN
jgi:hypothetical protein